MNSHPSSSFVSGTGTLLVRLQRLAINIWELQEDESHQKLIITITGFCNTLVFYRLNIQDHKLHSSFFFFCLHNHDKLRLICFKFSEKFNFPSGCILEKILSVQYLDDLDIEGIYPLYEQLQNHFLKCPQDR